MEETPEELTQEKVMQLSLTEPELPKVSILDRLRFIPFVLTFVVILFCFEVIQRVAALFGAKAHQWSVNGLNQTALWSLAIVGVKIDVTNNLIVDPHKPYIIVSNHQSLFDIPIIATAFHKLHPRFIAKKELARFLPSVSFNLNFGKHGIIDRSDARQALPAVKELALRMKSDIHSCVIFPEGTRARRGALKFFKPSGFSTLVKTLPEAEIIPVTIDCSWKLSVRKKGPIPSGTTVKLVVGNLMQKDEDENPKEFLTRVEDVIRNNLAKIRAV